MGKRQRVGALKEREMGNWFFFLAILCLILFTGIVATFSPTTYYWLLTKIGRGLLLSRRNKRIIRMLALIDNNPEAFEREFPATIKAVQFTGICSLIFVIGVVLLLLTVR